MLKETVRIFTQFTDENGKDKGGQVFELLMDADHLLYDEKICIGIFQEMIDEKTKNHAGKFEYVDHEVLFFEPIKLDGNVFEHKLIKKCQEERG